MRESFVLLSQLKINSPSKAIWRVLDGSELTQSVHVGQSSAEKAGDVLGWECRGLRGVCNTLEMFSKLICHVLKHRQDV